jgi:hypothetical protein
VIDFRYHLVSIVAVFLALAVGIAVGSTALRPGVTRLLSAASAHEKKQIDSLLAQQRSLEQQISADQAFAQAAASRLLPGLLTGQNVAIVDAPGADGQTIDGIATALRQAGAKITGQIGLQQPFFDTSVGSETRLSVLAQQLAPAGLGLGSQPADSKLTGQENAAQVIAAALVTGIGPAWSATQSQTILNGFGNQGYLQVSAGTAGGTTLSSPATLAVVVIPATPPASDTDPANLALIAFARELQTASHGAVVAGTLGGSGSGSAIDEIASIASSQLSTVDDASEEIGQITVAQALHNMLTGKKPASYGVGPGVFPSPAPSPQAVAAANPAATGPPASTAADPAAIGPARSRPGKR